MSAIAWLNVTERVRLVTNSVVRRAVSRFWGRITPDFVELANDQIRSLAGEFDRRGRTGPRRAGVRPYGRHRQRAN
ncbi:hypothetical protein ACFVGM_29730 [Kitasatospora purpeofusca]|uniref:hypothetical protein n=1 Tax=Kitasatospora purpeofusca TaxID=67352 RepID=UPI0011EA6E98